MFAPPIKAPKPVIALSAASLRGGAPNGHREQETHPEPTAVSQTARSPVWDFSKIPIRSLASRVRGARIWHPKSARALGRKESNQIRFLQVARLTETASGELHQFGGSQAPLNEMRSQPGEYAEGGLFVDTHPDPASRRTQKSDLPVEPYYNATDQSGQSRVTSGNKTGFNSGGAVSPAVLEDHPRSANPVKYEFISTAKGADNGAWYGSVFWGFEIYIDERKAKLRNENLKISESEGRDTSAAAVKAFDEYYRNPGAASEPKIP